MTITRIFIACFFLAYGLLTATNFRFEHSNVIMGILALVCAALLFFKREPAI